MLGPGRFKALLAATATIYAVGALLAGLNSWRAGRSKGVFSARASHDRVLAVVVPIYDGDEAPAMAALSTWPTTCYHSTLNRMDLVIYKAEALTESDHLPQIPHEASKCFRRTKIIGGNLLPEVSVFCSPVSIPSFIFLEMYSRPRPAVELEFFPSKSPIPVGPMTLRYGSGPVYVMC